MPLHDPLPDTVDLLVVGGGINGVGVARDAAGRGLSVALVEKDDLAAHTSSASTKLIHGGLRYLQYGEFRLVRESLQERERLWGMAPHIIRPMRFVVPPMPTRPGWMVRAGLFLYDHIGGRERLPATQTVRLADAPKGEGLARRGGKAFVYSDCWVDDARLVVLNAMDAAARGAAIRTHARFARARREGGAWLATIGGDGGGSQTLTAKAIVNTAGPWVGEVAGAIAGARTKGAVRLVKGSHIVVPRLYPGDHAFLLQNPDKRVIFAIPYEGAHTLIGTTDVPVGELPTGKVAISDAEIDYLLAAANAVFARQVTRGDIVWTYSGIRPLFDDEKANASAVTRDYVLDLDLGDRDEAPLLNVFGGKITTYRRLAEQAMDRLVDAIGAGGGAWTAGAVLPGGAFASFEDFLIGLARRYPGFPHAMLRRMARAYGTRAETILGDAHAPDDLGADFGGGLHQAEVDYLIAHEWATCGEDILWRRSKLGLHLPPSAERALDDYCALAMAPRLTAP
ncbi:glycerol-3-phosphate dehydrogenase [Croceicoccus sp. BE223]|uniref:glycerol-3-phosphate dehydrogenase n=1 Tax=Croceicoccus sp. BE223 TaxID=2817716 RepID=UPI00286606F2|nr:glycerol-3-phosphate dehydrogenase [Croceicoccus sp. BE223]MDR7101698.1 glycerol-3-phosphate dehydrogenase [Croceicoccus sp. BE223]